MHDHRTPRRPHADLGQYAFVCLMLLLVGSLIFTVEFARIAIVDASAYTDGSNDATRNTLRTPTKRELSLTILLADSALTVATDAGMLPSVRFSMSRRYIAKEDGREFLVDQGCEPPLHPTSGRQLGTRDLDEVVLFALDSVGRPAHAWYTGRGEVVVDGARRIATDVGNGMLFGLSAGLRPIAQAEQEHLQRAPLAAIDQLRCILDRLAAVRQSFADSASVTIASDGTVPYDVIIHVIDAARAAGFPNVSIARMRV